MLLCFELVRQKLLGRDKQTFALETTAVKTFFDFVMVHFVLTMLPAFFLMHEYWIIVGLVIYSVLTNFRGVHNAAEGGNICQA
jgi:hypothetical protein